jgi:hypothetical protein
MALLPTPHPPRAIAVVADHEIQAERDDHNKDEAAESASQHGRLGR